MARKKFKTSKPVRVLFYGAAAGVGLLLAATAARKSGKDIKRGGEKIVGKAKRTFKARADKLNDRQKKIISLFDREEMITNEMVQSVVKGVTQRTIRRDLNFLEEKGYIKQVGKTKGSYYVLN